MQVHTVEKIIGAVIGVLTAVASAMLAIMMFLMAADVIFRYFLNSPIPGGLELVEYMMAIIVPFSIAYCAFRRSHVAVDMIVDHFPRYLRLFIEIVTTTLSILFVSILCWQNVLNIFDSYDSGMTSAVLKLPSYPFAIPVAVGMGLFAIILLGHLVLRKSKETTHGTN